ncbi:MAG: phenylacetate--CoA ligase family protein [Gammaproteobacteria bacterium]
MNKNLVRRFLYLIATHASGRKLQLKAFQEMQRSQFLSFEEIDRLQWQRLESLLLHAYRNIPYYRTILETKGLNEKNIADNPGQILANLPLLDKTIIRQQDNNLLSKDFDKRRSYKNTSGGSTGEPVQLVQDLNYLCWAAATGQLYDNWSGYNLGDPKVLLWGSERDLMVGRETILTKIRRWIRNDYWFNSFRMTDEDMRRYVNQLNQIRPVQLLAYVEAAYELAEFVAREKLHVFSPKAIMTSAGTLTPPMRQRIAQAFGAPVFNRYGSREASGIACECDQHQGLHVNPFVYHMEILREDGTPCQPGELGEVVLTILTNFSMPLIRYRIGDMAAWADHQCACGRNWPLLESVEGRVNSMIRTDEGCYSSAALTSLLYFKDKNKKDHFRSFYKYQLVQKKVNVFIFRVVIRDHDLWMSEKDIIMSKLIATFGEGTQINIKEETDIEPSPSGKYFFIWSELN